MVRSRRLRCSTLWGDGSRLRSLLVSLSGMLTAGAEMWESAQARRLGACGRGTYVAQPPPS
eukprot:1099291-Pleurochrysis_carterae.AAC.1